MNFLPNGTPVTINGIEWKIFGQTPKRYRLERLFNGGRQITSLDFEQVHALLAQPITPPPAPRMINPPALV